jgi:hypothetical protein
MTEVVYFLLLYIAIQQKSCVLLLCIFLLMDLLQIVNKIVYLGDVKELSNNVRWLHETKSEGVLIDCTCIIALGIVQISMQFGYFGQKGLLAILVFGKSPGLVVEGSLKEGLYFEGVNFFS